MTIHLCSLGRHLHRSVLRICLPAARLEKLVFKREVADAISHAESLRVAERLVAAAGPRADALHAELTQMHAASVAQFARASNTAEVHALWQTALRTENFAGAYWATLTHPMTDRALRHLAFGDVEMLQPDPVHADPLRALTGRRSVSPRRLGTPAPESADVERMLLAALSAPDHGRLHPWRVLEIRAAQREALADLFLDEKRRRDPLASAADLRRARAHATDAPCLLAFVVSPRVRKRIPVREQWLAAGAAMGNLLNAAHHLGYGAIMLSGDRCFDEVFCQRLGLTPGESLGGFISIGTIVEAPPSARRALPQERWTCWTPETPPREARDDLQLPSPRSLSEEGIE